MKRLKMKRLNKLVIQLGQGRDGRRPFAAAAGARGLQTMIVEGPAGRSALGRGDLYNEAQYSRTVLASSSRAADLKKAALDALTSGDRVVAVQAGYDLYTLAVAELAAELELIPESSVEVARRFRSKSLQRRHLAGTPAGRYQPMFAVANAADDAFAAAESIGYPVVIKLDDSSGCRGVELARDASECRRRSVAWSAWVWRPATRRAARSWSRSSLTASR